MEAIPSSIPLSDGIGVVAAMGAGVSRVKMGDRVAAIFYPNWLDGEVSDEKLMSPLGGAAADGVLAEKAVFDDSSVVHVPEHLSDEEAATLPCAGVTAWNAVAADGRVAPGDSGRGAWDRRRIDLRASVRPVVGRSRHRDLE